MNYCHNSYQFTGNNTKAEHVVYVIAIPANRYDLLCLEGFARAVRIFLGKDQAPVRLLSFIPSCDNAKPQIKSF